MKTNITMASIKDRELFGVTIKQQTNGEMLSLTDLQEAYTRARIQNGWSKIEVKDILRNQSNWERIFYILNEQELLPDSIKGQILPFMTLCESEGITKVLKSFGVYKTTGRGENKSVYCNPYIWVLVAMELNPMLYARVVTWLTDKLILNRIEAGDFYKDLTRALYEIPDTDYKKLAMLLNYKIFGKHETGIRNKGSEKELYNLKMLESGLAFSIDQGYIKDMKGIEIAIKNFREVA